MRKALIILMMMVLAGCIPPPPPPVPEVKKTGPEIEFENAGLLAKEKKYSEAISAYRKIAADSPQSSFVADALYEVAYLQAFYENPQKDYAQALQGLDEFLKRYPDHAKAPDARNWRVVLKTILDTKKDNDRLNKNIEQLKKLDIRHEERRRK